MSTVILINPKFPHNVGAAVRACACWGIPELYWTGDRVQVALDAGDRLPREERMKGYRNVRFERDLNPLARWNGDVTPVAVEYRPTAESLVQFEHPESAVYIFGPEDDSIPKAYMAMCHRFVWIPTHHCLNLAAAVNVVLYDRRLKRVTAGLENAAVQSDLIKEHRGFIE